MSPSATKRRRAGSTWRITRAALDWQPALTVVAATVLAIESLVFVGVHVKYREITPMILSAALGLLIAVLRAWFARPDAAATTAPSMRTASRSAARAVLRR